MPNKRLRAHLKTSAKTFIAALFGVDKNRKQPECTSMMNYGIKAYLPPEYMRTEDEQLTTASNNGDAFHKHKVEQKKPYTKANTV